MKGHILCLQRPADKVQKSSVESRGSVWCLLGGQSHPPQKKGGDRWVYYLTSSFNSNFVHTRLDYMICLQSRPIISKNMDDKKAAILAAEGHMRSVDQ